jgi:hypothetical protein
MRFALAVLLTCAAAAPGLAAADRPSPPFSVFRTGASEPVPLASLRGKVVALAFIDTNCTHCQELTRTVLVPVAREYGPRGVEVVECAFNDAARDQVPLFIHAFEPPFTVGWNTRAAVLAYLQISMLDMRPLYVPHMVFIDRRGMIRGDYPGEDPFFKDAAKNVRAELDRLLKLPAAPAKRKK